MGISGCKKKFKKRGGVGKMWQLSIGSPAAAASCLPLNTVDIDHDVNVVDVMLTVR